MAPFCLAGPAQVSLNPLEIVIKKMATKCGHINFIFPAPTFTWVLDLLLASHPSRLFILLILQPHSTLWLIHNTAVLLGKTKLFQHEHVCQNCRIVVKQNMFDHAEFLMMMLVCEEQLSHFLVLQLISFQKLLNF